MFSYIGLWFAVIYSLIVVAFGITYYFKFPSYHNTRTLLALAACIVLALAGLLVLFVQPYLPLPARVESRLSSSLAIYMLITFIFYALVLYPQWKRQGRAVPLAFLAAYAIIGTIYAIAALYTIITSIYHY